MNTFSNVLAGLFVGIGMAVVLVLSLFCVVSGMQNPEKNGSMMVAGAVLIGSLMITFAISSNNGRVRDN